MVRNILILLFVGCLMYFGYYEYKQQQEVARLNSGDFTCRGCDSPVEHAQFLKENADETADGNSERKSASGRIAAEEATAATTQGATKTPSMMAPAAPVVVPTTEQPGAMAAGLPAADSVAPNPSNGMRFAGSGSYQWYRQGNLTWRVDTTTGRSCIIYATMEEWRKQIVMSHGCGRTA